jgi:hypothetical protein
MLKPTLATLTLAIALAVVPASAQQSQPQAIEPGADTSLVGLPVFSSDGEMLGQVTETVVFGARPAVRAEMSAFLGFGSGTVLIDADVFQKKADRIELSMTAAEVKETISSQDRKPSQ